jgi:DNA-binding FrmR family transcriptional regulator
MTVTTHATDVGHAAGCKADQLARQARIEGPVRGLVHMAAGNLHCAGVLTQISVITWRHKRSR